jgi:hypothetical protein
MNLRTCNALTIIYDTFVNVGYTIYVFFCDVQDYLVSCFIKEH